MAVWLGFLIQGDTLSLFGYLQAQDWHIHEMLFGFMPAAVAGFLLTAVPNWTGRLPVRGIPLAVLTLIWFLGRLSILFSGIVPESFHIVIAVLDSLFLIMFSALLAREILAGNNLKNVPVVGIVAALAISNVLFHLTTLEIMSFVSSHQISLVAIMLVVLLVTLIGGRIVPSFTRNWMVRNNITPLPASRSHVDKVGSALIPLTSLMLLFGPQSTLTSAMCILTAVTHLFRLSRWRGLATIREPLVFVLHVGYSWIAIGFLLAGLSILSDDIPFVAAIHAFTAGMFGTMILAVMTRATRGHSGQSLEADFGTVAIFIFVNLSAVIRIASALWGYSEWGYLLSGLSWIIAFALFSVLYFPYFMKR